MALWCGAGIAQEYPMRPKIEPRSGRGVRRRLREESLFLLADFGRDERGGDEGLRECATGMRLSWSTTTKDSTALTLLW